MAETLRLANEAQTTTYDFLGGTLKPLMDTWQTSPPTPDGTIVETFIARGIDTNANIVPATDTLEEMAENAALFIEDSTNGNSIWFEQRADPSDTTKRALVLALEIIPVWQNKFTP